MILLKLTTGFLLKVESIETNAEVQKLRPSWKVQGTLRDFCNVCMTRQQNTMLQSHARARESGRNM